MVVTIQPVELSATAANNENERFILWLCELAQHYRAEFDRTAIDRMLQALGSSPDERSYLLACLFDDGYKMLQARASNTSDRG